MIDLDSDIENFEEPELVNNSQMDFFYKEARLDEYKKQKMPETPHIIKMTEGISKPDFTKQEIAPIPENKSGYQGPVKLVYTGGTVQEYVGVTDTGYTLKGGSQVSKEDSFEIILDAGIWGSTSSTPHKIEQVNKYYAAFTGQLQNMYFKFSAGNEFASIKLSNLTGNVEYTLYDSNMNALKNGWNNSLSDLEVQYKNTDSATYILKLTGSFNETLAPFCIEIPSDANEWMWQMVYTDFGKESTGTFDYYGDEDYFVIPPQVKNNIDKSILRFTNISVETNVVIYDNARNVLAQFTYHPQKTSMVSLYSLENAYALSVYSQAGDSSNVSYSFRFEHIDTLLLDIQTYGFALSPGYTEDEDYYTTVIETLDGKKINDVMTAIPFDAITIKVAQQCGYEYTANVGEELKLGSGRNTVTISLKVGDISKTITIVISQRIDEVYFSYTKKGTKIFVVDDSPSQEGYENYVLIQKDTGEYAYVDKNTLFIYEQVEMPESYKEKIQALQAAHPNWKFTFVKTGYDFNSFVNAQNGYEGSTAIATLNGKKASIEDIAYYVDPRNFLTEQSVFMFEKQSYVKDAYSDEGIGSIWVEKESAALPESTYISYFKEAGKTVGISSYFITARAALESGYGTSPLSSGTIEGYEGYYNFYGINAVNHNPAAGVQYAKDRNWNTRRRAIIEGAAWIKNQYIGCMQFSAYFMKFSFIPTRTWHQYMTDVSAPYKDAQSYYKSHLNGGTLDTEIEFVIPVFDNMP